MSLKVLIKSPNQLVGDIEIQCDKAWTVGHVKDHLQTAYPTKPEPNQQRLIYCGRLLHDELKLKDILTINQDKHIMHLVCPHSTSPSNLDNSDRHTQGLQSPIESVIPTVTSHGDSLRQRSHNPSTAQFPANAYHPQGFPMPNFDATMLSSPYLAYQFAAMQQSYAQFMAQVLAQSQAIGQGQQPPYQPQPARPMEEPRDDFWNLLPLAPPNELDDGLNEPIDWLELFHIVMRLALLLTVMYFYSTPEKVFLVVILGLIFFFYRLVYYQPDQVHNERNGRRAPNSRVDNSQTEHAEDNSNGLQEDESSRPRDQTPRFSIVTFLITFFTSMIPEEPLPVQT